MEDRINDSVLRRILGGDAEACPVCEASHDCGEEKHTWGLKGYPLAMVYSPIQNFENIYDLDCALAAGTIFKELDLPFKGMTVSRGGCCRG